MWHSDIGSVVEADIGEEDWPAFKVQADTLYGHVGGLRKNALHISVSLAFAWNAGKRSPSLERLCTDILKAEDSI